MSAQRFFQVAVVLFVAMALAGCDWANVGGPW
jgi:hypothetical protein